MIRVYTRGVETDLARRRLAAIGAKIQAAADWRKTMSGQEGEGPLCDLCERPPERLDPLFIRRGPLEWIILRVCPICRRWVERRRKQAPGR
jgi:hypothetical protein